MKREKKNSPSVPPSLREDAPRGDESPRKMMLCGKRMNGQCTVTVIDQRVQWWTPTMPLMGHRLSVTLCCN